MKIKKLFFLMFFPMTIFGANHALVCSKEGLRFSHQQLIFSAKNHSVRPGLYAIKNKSNKTLWLNHELKNNPGVSAGWASEIAPNHWSVILITRNPAEFAMQCQYQEKNGPAKNVACKKVIHACQLKDYFSHKPITSSYWVVENQTHDDMMKHLHARGFSFS